MIYFIISMTFLTVIYFILEFSKEVESFAEKRKKQLKNITKENAVKKWIYETVEKKANISKKMEFKKLCVQTGYNIKYEDFLIMSIISGLLMGVGFYYISNNIFLSFIFFIFGYSQPKQFLIKKRNQKQKLLENQIEPFLKMTLERYNIYQNMGIALSKTKEEFRGEEPIYSLLSEVDTMLKTGKSTQEALEYLGDISENIYLKRFAKYYKIVSNLGTEEARRKILRQAYIQFKKNKTLKNKLQKNLTQPKGDAYLLIFSIPALVVYQSFNTEGYLHTMTQTTAGQIGTTIIVLTIMFAIWFINNFITRPIK